MRYYRPINGAKIPQGNLFSTGTCETCTRQIQEPNAVTLFPTASQLTRIESGKCKLRLWPEDKPLPPEIWWDDDLEQTVCDREDCRYFALGGE